MGRLLRKIVGYPLLVLLFGIYVIASFLNKEMADDLNNAGYKLEGWMGL